MREQLEVESQSKKNIGDISYTFATSLKCKNNFDYKKLRYDIPLVQHISSDSSSSKRAIQQAAQATLRSLVDVVSFLLFISCAFLLMRCHSQAIHFI